MARKSGSVSSTVVFLLACCHEQHCQHGRAHSYLPFPDELLFCAAQQLCCAVYKAILWPVATKGVGILEMLETAPNDYRVLSNLTFAVPTHQRWRSESTVSPRNDCYVPFFFFTRAPRPRCAPDSRGSRDVAPGDGRSSRGSGLGDRGADGRGSGGIGVRFGGRNGCATAAFRRWR